MVKLLEDVWLGFVVALVLQNVMSLYVDLDGWDENVKLLHCFADVDCT